jgi:hypothetical protein
LWLVTLRRRFDEGQGGGIIMRKQPPSAALKDQSLGVAIVAALALKAVALVALYFAFFLQPPDRSRPAERTATAVFGLPGR